MINSLTNRIIYINPEEVYEKAAEYDLYTSDPQGFRDLDNHYDRIEQVMDAYSLSFSNSSFLGGLTAGIGGLATTLTLSAVDITSLSLQLFHLAQRFAILNGFDQTNPLHEDKIMKIYLESLGFSSTTQAILKYQLLKAGANACSQKASENVVLKVITLISKGLGKKISARGATRMIPVLGGIAGATVNYSFARNAVHKMKEAYKKAYLKTC